MQPRFKVTAPSQKLQHIFHCEWSNHWKIPSKETNTWEKRQIITSKPQAQLYPGVLEECDTDTKWYLENDCQAYANIWAFM